MMSYSDEFVIGLKERIDSLQKQLAEKDREIERLKMEYTCHIKNNLCRCCGAILSDEEKQSHNCGKKQILTS